jgi:hypothetical protein
MLVILYHIFCTHRRCSFHIELHSHSKPSFSIIATTHIIFTRHFVKWAASHQVRPTIAQLVSTSLMKKTNKWLSNIHKYRWFGISHCLPKYPAYRVQYVQQIYTNALRWHNQSILHSNFERKNSFDIHRSKGEGGPYPHIHGMGLKYKGGWEERKHGGDSSLF